MKSFTAKRLILACIAATRLLPFSIQQSRPREMDSVISLMDRRKVEVVEATHSSPPPLRWLEFHSFVCGLHTM